ncbi:MAG: hypothetical protein JST47_10450 [Bacteroidetes bacterium]|nr:hypothetical protein [Bacteroidota bacterium]MBS1974759.1 hypothetical protein [Bacteroidota bacterium]
MTNNHPSEEIIQQYVLDNPGCGADAVSHIYCCAVCKAKADAYEMLFNGIEEQPKPAFDFDLPGAIMQKVPLDTEPSMLRENIPTFLMSAAVIAAAGIAGYFYRPDVVAFCRKNLLSILSGVPKGVLYLLITPVLAILIFQVIELFKKYQKKINNLNFY